jgi:putative intracellular protease/amidase
MRSHLVVRARFTLLAIAGFLLGCEPIAADPSSALPKRSEAIPARSAEERIEPYRARFGRRRPVIAVVGANSGTELTDYVIPYGILRQAELGEVVAVATEAGPITMRPVLRIRAEATIAEFDASFPDGADYVVVPAVVRRDDPALLGWIRQQAAKGGTLVSICDGALVLANSGVMNRHRATAHWATDAYRRKTYPQVNWVEDRRYVADGKVVSSAGISAAIPTSLALIEAIAGHERAASVAAQIGARDWSPIHDSRSFHPRFGRNLSAFAATQYFNRWFHRPETIGIPVSADPDDVALALTADAYARTGRARVIAIGRTDRPVQTRHGLTVLPDQTEARSVERTVEVPADKPALTLDRVLPDIARRFGRQTAYGVALDFEYPDFHG